VSIDGIDGSGKSVSLVERLREKGRAVVQTKEPDGGRLVKRSVPA
jgi:thymidylate kinase